MDNRLLEKSECLNALIEGFVIVIGEKHREFLTKYGTEILERGIINGEAWGKKLALSADRISVYVEMANEGIFEKEKLQKIIDGLKEFFTEDEIEFLKVRHDKPTSHLFLEGTKHYERLFVDTIKNEDFTYKKAVPFDYFHNFFPFDSKSKEVSLYGEAGLGLDQYSPKNLKYDKFEGELYYPIEAIWRKFHYCGMLIGKQNVLFQWVNSIKTKMTIDTEYITKRMLCNIIYELALGSIADSIIIDIQSHTGVTEGFMTHKQVSQSLKKMAKERISKKDNAEIKALAKSLKDSSEEKS